MKRLLLLLLIICGLTFIISCEKSSKPKINEPHPEVVLGENTIILHNHEELISTFTEDGTITFTSSTSQIDSLRVGNIIISGITPMTPCGFLRKIDAINGLEIETSEATFEDAFKELHVNFSTILKPENLIAQPTSSKGVSYNPNKSIDNSFSFDINKVIYENNENKVLLTGEIEFSSSLNFNVDIFSFELTKLKFVNKIQANNRLSISATSEFYGVDETYEIAKMHFIPIAVGPLVICPIITLDINGKATAEMAIAAEVSQSVTLEAGFEYNNGNWDSLSNIDINFPAFNAPEILANASLEASVTPQINLLIYGVTAPYVEPTLYGRDTITLSGDPWWKIEGGVEAGAGVELRIMSRRIADYHNPSVINHNAVIAQAENVLHGTLKGIIYDAVTQTLLSNVNIRVNKGSDVIVETSNDVSGQYEIELPVAQNYTVIFSKPDYQELIYSNVAISGLNQTHLEPVMQIDNAHLGLGNISGQIFNALNNMPESDVVIFLRRGMNQMESQVLRESVTDSNGSYMLEDIDSGNYTIEATKEDYTNSYFNVYCLGNETVSGQNGVITPELTGNDIRIILTWGEVPRDLDSHITGPTVDDSGRFHVYYGNRSYYYGDQTYVDLDLDDVSSYGPETVTIYNQLSGLYRYTVHDYTNGHSTECLQLSNSNAQVRVYMGSTLLRSFNVPANVPGTAWTVFEMHGTVINAINEISGMPDYKGNFDLINLPDK